MEVGEVKIFEVNFFEFHEIFPPVLGYFKHLTCEAEYS